MTLFKLISCPKNFYNFIIFLFVLVEKKIGNSSRRKLKNTFIAANLSKIDITLIHKSVSYIKRNKISSFKNIELQSTANFVCVIQIRRNSCPISGNCRSLLSVGFVV